MGGIHSHSRHQVPVPAMLAPSPIQEEPLEQESEVLDEGSENNIDVGLLEPCEEQPLEQGSEEPPPPDEKPEEAPEETPSASSPMSPLPCWGRSVQRGRMLGSTQDLPGFGSCED